MLISEGYRDLNQTLHQSQRYGEHGDKWASAVRRLVEEWEISTILDYGCGKGSLKRALDGQVPAQIFEYDPAIPEKSEMPAPADLIVCTDVLEHVEPECITAVIDHLHALSRKILFVVVSTRPAVKFLADGRNAHLIVQPMADWLPSLTRGFRIVETKEKADEFALTLHISR